MGMSTAVGLGHDTTELLRAHSICFVHECFQLRIDVGGLLQTKMMPKAEDSVVLDTPEERMLGATTQPKTRIQIRRANDCTGKAHPRHDDDPTLLRIGFHRPTCP